MISKPININETDIAYPKFPYFQFNEEDHVYINIDGAVALVINYNQIKDQPEEKNTKICQNIQTHIIIINNTTQSVKKCNYIFLKLIPSKYQYTDDNILKQFLPTIEFIKSNYEKYYKDEISKLKEGQLIVEEDLSIKNTKIVSKDEFIDLINQIYLNQERKSPIKDNIITTYIIPSEISVNIDGYIINGIQKTVLCVEDIKYLQSPHRQTLNEMLIQSNTSINIIYNKTHENMFELNIYIVFINLYGEPNKEIYKIINEFKRCGTAVSYESNTGIHIENGLFPMMSDHRNEIFAQRMIKCEEIASLIRFHSHQST